MHKTTLVLCALACSAAPVAASAPGSPVRISAPVSVEPVMTVEMPDAMHTVAQLQPVLGVDAASQTDPTDVSGSAQGEPIVAADDAGAGSAEVASFLPATERLPLGQAASSGAAEGRAGASSGLRAIAQTGGALAAVIGLILGLRFVMVKLSGATGGLRAQLGAAGKAPSGVLFVLGRYPVSRGMSLVLLQLDQRVLLLSQTSAGFHTLAEIGDPSEVASILQKVRDENGESLGAKFTGMLKQFERDPGTLSDLDTGAESRPVRLRRTGEQEAGEPLVARGQAGGFYEDKLSSSAVRTGEDELRSRINRMREFGS